MTGIRLLCAFQVLALPEGAYPGATHEMARIAAVEITGAWIPQTVTVPKGLSLDGYMEWLRAAVAADPETFGIYE